MNIIKVSGKGGWYYQVDRALGNIPGDENIEKYSFEEFFDMHDFPTDYDYSEYFKYRFHELGGNRVIRCNDVVSELRKAASGQPRRMKNKKDEDERAKSMKSDRRMNDELKCLAKVGYKNIFHEHVDGLLSGWLFNLNSSLKRVKCQSLAELRDMTSNFKGNYGRYTGHWMVFTVLDGRRLYLDICRHDDDDYLVGEALPKYKAEFPAIFK
ncbi:hypothetical protein ACV1D8_15940 [Aeromonas caviae]